MDTALTNQAKLTARRNAKEAKEERERELKELEDKAAAREAKDEASPLDAEAAEVVQGAEAPAAADEPVEEKDVATRVEELLKPDEDEADNEQKTPQVLQTSPETPEEQSERQLLVLSLLHYMEYFCISRRLYPGARKAWSDKGRLYSSLPPPPLKPYSPAEHSQEGSENPVDDDEGIVGDRRGSIKDILSQTRSMVSQPEEKLQLYRSQTKDKES